MTDFLGRRDRIKNLQKDLVDLQGAILDVFSRTGPVHFSSWKFPDKTSCNLDMVALLDQNDFIDGEDKLNQHSHIVLLELVIDRLLLLLQSFDVFVEQRPNSFKTYQTQEKGLVSLGLVVRNYWSNLVTYKASSNQSSSDRCSSAKSSTSTPKVDTQNVGSQTFETCLVPCHACYQSQSVLRKTGGALVELCLSEGLPSSLQLLLVAMQDTVELGRMTAIDVAQWGTEESRDIRRLTKHLQDVRGTVEPLKAKIMAVETEKDRLKSDVKRLQKELKDKVENFQAINVQLEFSLQKAQRAEKEAQQRQKEEQQKSQREILSLGELNSSVMAKVAVLQDTIKALETENNSLQEKIRLLQEEKESCSHQLQNKIQELQVDISELQLCLDKEKAKYNSACRQQESMQAKQKYLVERVDGLDEECEDLQRQVAEREEKQIELHGQIQQISEDREQLQAKLNQQQDSCVKLETDKETLRTKNCDLENTVAELKQQIKACTERERLLVAFPDLNPLPQAQPQSTGSVTLDMEQQFKANCIRIQVLEQENTTLYCSLLKLKERAQPSDETKKLWNGWPRIEEYSIGDVQWSLLPSGSEQQLQQYSNNRKEAEGESSPKSAASEDRMSDQIEEYSIGDVQWSLSPSGSEEQLQQYSNSRKEAQWKSRLKSAASGARMSASSLSSVQLHFQTLPLHPTTAKIRTNRTFQQRKK